MQMRQRDHVTCPRQKHQRADWASLFAQKQGAKQNGYSRFATPPPITPGVVGAAFPERMAKQQEFLDALKNRQAELDAMPQTEREHAYAELKSSILEPSVVTMGIATAGAGIEHGIEVPILSKSLWVLNPNESYTFETLNLSPAGDTVINVQDYYTGGFVDGNDDCNTRLSTCSGRRSYLTIAPSGGTRYVWVIVRSYNEGTTWDSATLRVTEGTHPPNDYSVNFTGGYHEYSPSFPSGTHFVTTQEPNNTVDDTVMLVTTWDPGHGMAFDDDSGTAWMSGLHMTKSCSSCYVILGGYSQGTTTFIWDKDADISSKNCDSDGLSDTLEDLIGSARCNNDTDADGIDDYEELIGVDDWPYELLNFPYYGANPLQPDVFIEADWKKCPSCTNVDQNRMSGGSAATVASFYSGAGLSIHIDTGEFNSNPATRTIFNHWGGATSYSSRGISKCEFLSPSRVGYFHTARIEPGDGQAYFPPNPCFDSNGSAVLFAHELGHTLNLRHGGDTDTNCKPNYYSIMNYAFQQDFSTLSGMSPFSNNSLSAPTLNPLQINEGLGLGTTDPVKLSIVTGSAMRFHVDALTGSVDWNRNGRIDSGLVRAAVTWGASLNGCGVTQSHLSYAPSGNRYSALSYMPWPASSPRLHWFTRRASDGKLEYRVATSFPESCGAPSSSCTTNWGPSVNLPAMEVPSSLSGDDAPAAAWYQDGSGTNKLVLVYKDAANHLRYQVLTAAFHLGGGWVPSWTSPGYISSSEVIAGSPAAVTWNGQIYVYAIGSGDGLLKKWTLSPSGAWSGPVDQQWADGSDIQATFGIGVAKGYLQNSGVPEEHVFAAIPNQGASVSLIDLAWLDATTGKWSRLDEDRWPSGTRAPCLAQPGLAYEPFDRDTNMYDGRFYLSFGLPGVMSSGQCIAGFIWQSEGNQIDSGASDRRLVFLPETAGYYATKWDCPVGNMTLYYDLDYDKNVRGAYTRSVDSPEFSPFADGIFDEELTDYDDYTTIRTSLRCALGLEQCP